MSDQFDEMVTRFFKEYHDRGMMKWAGFYLSDHTQQLEKKAAQAQHIVTKQPQLPLTEIKQRLIQAFNQHQTVTIQLNSLQTDTTKIPELSGHITAFTADGIELNQQSLLYDEIDHVRLADG